jgi:hypothetical protein
MDAKPIRLPLEKLSVWLAFIFSACAMIEKVTKGKIARIVDAGKLRL